MTFHYPVIRQNYQKRKMMTDKERDFELSRITENVAFEKKNWIDFKDSC